VVSDHPPQRDFAAAQRAPALLPRLQGDHRPGRLGEIAGVGHRELSVIVDVAVRIAQWNPDSRWHRTLLEVPPRARPRTKVSSTHGGRMPELADISRPSHPDPSELTRIRQRGSPGVGGIGCGSLEVQVLVVTRRRSGSMPPENA
jgi:hypothetical protein